jgi:uncharacterized metal-binding protein YceD (DUF177 family)
MVKEKRNLIIPFVGLKEGMHHFDFEVDSTFFEQFEFSIIQKANFKIKVDFEKKKNLFNLHLKLKGTINSFCDRCNDPVEIKTKGEEDLIVKFGEDKFDETDEIKIISSSDFELDLSQEVYQFIHLLLPNKVQHKKLKDCNQEVVEKLVELSSRKEKEEADPRWAALKKLKDKND